MAEKLCVLQAGIVANWLNIGSRKEHCTTAQGLVSFLMPKILVKFELGHLQQRHQIPLR